MRIVQGGGNAQTGIRDIYYKDVTLFKTQKLVDKVSLLV